LGTSEERKISTIKETQDKPKRW